MQDEPVGHDLQANLDGEHGGEEVVELVQYLICVRPKCKYKHNSRLQMSKINSSGLCNSRYSYVVRLGLVVDRVLGGEHCARDENADEQRVAEPSVIAYVMTRETEAVETGEDEQRAGVRYRLDLLLELVGQIGRRCLDGSGGSSSGRSSSCSRCGRCRRWCRR